jgi:hypothetical protein
MFLPNTTTATSLLQTPELAKHNFLSEYDLGKFEMKI